VMAISALRERGIIKYLKKHGSEKSAENSQHWRLRDSPDAREAGTSKTKTVKRVNNK